MTATSAASEEGKSRMQIQIRQTILNQLHVFRAHDMQGRGGGKKGGISNISIFGVVMGEASATRCD
jgi:hypothetical protein